MCSECAVRCGLPFRKLHISATRSQADKLVAPDFATVGLPCGVCPIPKSSSSESNLSMAGLLITMSRRYASAKFFETDAGVDGRKSVFIFVQAVLRRRIRKSLACTIHKVTPQAAGYPKQGRHFLPRRCEECRLRHDVATLYSLYVVPSGLLCIMSSLKSRCSREVSHSAIRSRL